MTDEVDYDQDPELLDDDEAKGLNSGEKTFAAGGRKGRKTRGGELYDAFAGGSEDEDDEDFGSDGYRDRSADSGDDEENGQTEKPRRAARDDDDELHHVIGDDSDDEDERQDSRLLDRR